MNKEQAKQQLEILKESFEKETAKLKSIIGQSDRISPEDRFWQLCEGLTIKVYKKKYPNYIFFFKGGYVWFEYNTETGTLWCKHSTVWFVFENEYGLAYTEIQSLIKNQVEEHFKMKGLTPHPRIPSRSPWWKSISK